MTIGAILQNRDVRAVETIDSKSLIKHVVTILAERRIGAMPVVERGEVRGIISERDVLYGLAREGADILLRSVEEIMISPAITADPHMTVLDGLALMTKRRIRHLPVIEAGVLVGFVSIGDLVKYRIERIEAEAAAMRDYIQMA